MKPDKIKKLIMMIIPAAVLVALSAYLLQGDVWTFWTWYLLALVLGVAAMPLTGRLFRRFDDKGWIFSKVTGTVLVLSIINNRNRDHRFSDMVSGNCEDIEIYSSYLRGGDCYLHCSFYIIIPKRTERRIRVYSFCTS